MTEAGTVTTPFGRRPMTLALVRRQKELSDIEPGKRADKWKVFRDVSAAMGKLKIQSSSLAVLDALLSFYPETELRHDAQLIVFPSNVQLSLRAHGMAGATLRRHLAILVTAGLIVRRDSANGKRFARKNRAGQIGAAFGFDLSPLLARCEELAVMAQQVQAEKAAFKSMKETLTIYRRDVRKLISAAMEEGAAGDWQEAEEIYIELIARIPRRPTAEDLAASLHAMTALHTKIVKLLESQENTKNDSSNDAHNEQHKQNSKSDSNIELEPRFGNEREANPGHQQRRSTEAKVFPLGMILRACPTTGDYARGSIQTWRDFMSAAVVVRSVLGISPAAYQDACEVLGPENAATAVACMLERANFINSPGGYLRDLARRYERGEFSLGPMVMALLRANGSGSHLRTG